MKQYVIYTQWANPPPHKSEKMVPGSKVTLAGYVPADERIKIMLASGRRLYDARTAVYDIPDGKNFNPDEVKVDPSRHPSYEMDDAYRDMANAKMRLQAVVKKRKEEISAEKKAKELDLQQNKKSMEEPKVQESVPAKKKATTQDEE